MSELQSIVITSSLTILGGLLIFVIGHQIIPKFFIEPIHEQRRLISEIVESLFQYEPLYMNPIDGGQGKLEPDQKKKRDKASKVIYQQSRELRARTYVIPWYQLWQLLRLVRKQEDIEAASMELKGLSSGFYRAQALPDLPNENQRRRNEIRKR